MVVVERLYTPSICKCKCKCKWENDMIMIEQHVEVGVININYKMLLNYCQEISAKNMIMNHNLERRSRFFWISLFETRLRFVSSISHVSRQIWFFNILNLIYHISRRGQETKNWFSRSSKNSRGNFEIKIGSDRIGDRIIFQKGSCLSPQSGGCQKCPFYNVKMEEKVPNFKIQKW